MFSLNFLWAVLGGTLPALFWLWFWLKEDKLHPEPKKRLVASFICGMAAVMLVLPIERYLYEWLGPAITVITLFSWAAAEELLKFFAAYISGFFRNKSYDEPIDSLMYLISSALGFSALENAFFLLNIINSGQITQSIMSGNMRFLGAALLHVACSATIGFFMSLAFYKPRDVRQSVLVIGVLLAIALHTLFNSLIMRHEESLFFIFGGVWVAIVSLILIFEKVKTIRR